VNFIPAIFQRLAGEIRAQRLGRRALREVQFAKYKVAPRQDDRTIRDRILLGVPPKLGLGLFQSLTSR
jgi:hypothetical protein